MQRINAGKLHENFLHKLLTKVQCGWQDSTRTA